MHRSGEVDEEDNDEGLFRVLLTKLRSAHPTFFDSDEEFEDFTKETIEFFTHNMDMTDLSKYPTLSKKYEQGTDYLASVFTKDDLEFIDFVKTSFKDYDVVRSKFVEHPSALRLIKEIPVIITITEAVEFLRSNIEEKEESPKLRAARFIH